MTPPAPSRPSRPPTKKPAVLLSRLSPVPSIEAQFATSPGLSPPPSTQARRPIGKRGVASAASQHGKPALVKKTVVDRFNDSREDENRRLSLKRKMEHDEKMASIRLKRHKYDLRYGSTPGPQTSASSTPALATTAATKEDKQIEILRLQIRLAELTRDNSAASAHVSTRMTHAGHASASSSRVLHNSLEDVSTPSSGMSGLSYLGSRGDNSFGGNNFIASEDPGRYVPNDEGPSHTTSWPETYDFTA